MLRIGCEYSFFNERRKEWIRGIYHGIYISVYHAEMSLVFIVKGKFHRFVENSVHSFGRKLSTEHIKAINSREDDNDITFYSLMEEEAQCGLGCTF